MVIRDWRLPGPWIARELSLRQAVTFPVIPRKENVSDRS